MPTYRAVLPEVFHYAVRIPVFSVENITHMLISGGNGRPNGSSFAVTSDAPSGYRTIWLSEASYRTLIDAHIIPDLYPAMSSETVSFVDFVMAGGKPTDWKGDMPSPADWAELKRRKHARNDS